MIKEFNYKINGTQYNAKVTENEDNTLSVNLNGKDYIVELPFVATSFRPVLKPAVAVSAPAAAPVAAVPSRPAAPAAGSGDVIAPLPGTITDVKVTVGQKVKKGDVVLIMEAMKMANDIVAEANGTVKEIKVKKGDSANQGDVLVVMECEAAPAAPAAAPKPVAAPKPAPAAGASVVAAPLPGTITKINVTEGKAVQAGEVLMVMEAMKMANDIVAETAGTVKKIFVQQGAQVQSGEALVELA